MNGTTEAIIFVADGRFHLEAIMIANPSIPAYRYDKNPPRSREALYFLFIIMRITILEPEASDL